MNFKMPIILTLFFLCCGMVANAQNSIQGQFLNEENEGLPFTNILLLNAQDSSFLKGEITDENGGYAFENIKNGKYILSATMMGYEEYFSAVFELNNSTKKFKPVLLQESVNQLEGVGVTASKAMIEVENNKVILNVAESALLNSGTALETLSKAPGITIDQDGNISLKGKQNVTVMMDGKLTYLSAEQLSQLLENTPADNIAKIEIIENPSAKYDAQGNSGIINIEMKRDKNLGTNGNVFLKGGYGKYEKYGGGITLNHRTKKIATSVSYDQNFRKSYQLFTINRRIPFENGITNFDQTADFPKQNTNHNYRINTDWYAGKNTTIGAMVSGSFGEWQGLNDGETKISGLNPNSYNTLRSDVQSTTNWNNLSGNLNLQQKIGKASLTMDVDYSKWLRDGSQENTNRFFIENQEVEDPFAVLMLTDTKIDILAGKIDFSTPLDEKSNLEIGWKSSQVITDNTLDFSIKNNEIWENDAQRSNTFDYTENIHAGYINLNRNFGKLSIQTGLRAEHTISDGYSETLDQRNKREYLNFFPSVSASYKASEKHNFSVAYSRRIDRPSYEQLNPFIFFLDQYTFEKGNPFLNPQFTNSFSGTYTFNNASMLQVSYSKTTDAMMDVFEQDNEAQSTYITNANLNEFENLSVTFSSPIPIQKWWMMNVSATGFNNAIRSPYSEGGQIDNSQFSYNFNINNNISLPWDVKMEVNFNYQSPTVWALFEIEPMYGTSFGFSKSFGKLKIRASGSDIFNTRQFATKVQQGDIDSDITNKWESRVFRLNLSYNFGNKNVKSSRKRQTASEELKKRAGNN